MGGLLSVWEDEIPINISQTYTLVQGIEVRVKSRIKYTLKYKCASKNCHRSGGGAAEHQAINLLC